MLTLFSDDFQARLLTSDTIITLVALLKDPEAAVCNVSIKMVSELSTHSEVICLDQLHMLKISPDDGQARLLTSDTTTMLVSLLGDGRPEVQSTSAAMISKLLKYGEIICLDQLHMLTLFSEKFWAWLLTPDTVITLVGLLNDPEAIVRDASIDMILELSTHSEIIYLDQLYMLTLISGDIRPRLLTSDTIITAVGLLRDNNVGGRCVSVMMISKLSQCSETISFNKLHVLTLISGELKATINASSTTAALMGLFKDRDPDIEDVVVEEILALTCQSEMFSPVNLDVLTMSQLISGNNYTALALSISSLACFSTILTMLRLLACLCCPSLANMVSLTL
jgi:hypothetical protein